MSKLDPAALAFHAVALAVLVVACVLLFLALRSDPPAPAGKGLQGMLDSAKKIVDRAAPAPKRAEPAKPQPPVASVKPAMQLPAGRVWRYNVSLEPPQWRDAVLIYRTAPGQSGTAVHTEFSHAGGKMNFYLGIFAANHPTHANVRFPGFFMHAAYFDKPLDVGQRFDWEWPWQLQGGAVRAGRVKRYAGEVKAWENVQAPVGSHAAARIESTLSYIEDGKVQASARETLWYAPGVQQFIRVVRDGATPDEGAKRIVAELAALQ